MYMHMRGSGAGLGSWVSHVVPTPQQSRRSPQRPASACRRAADTSRKAANRSD